MNDISFSMGNGVYGLLGVNGAGKNNVDENVMYTDNTRLWNDHMGWKRYLKMGASYRQILGYLPQDFGYYPYLTIYDYMMYIASIKGIRPAVAKKRQRNC